MAVDNELVSRLCHSDDFCSGVGVPPIVIARNEVTWQSSRRRISLSLDSHGATFVASRNDIRKNWNMRFVGFSRFSVSQIGTFR